MKKISVQELSEALKESKDFTLIDVREDYEYNIGHIQSVHIPMDNLSERINELNCDKETYVICKSGNRASSVANFLEINYNFSDIGVVIGGIEAYANEIDQSIEII